MSPSLRRAAALVAALTAAVAGAACAGRARVTPRELCTDSERGCTSGSECTWDDTRRCTMCYCREPDDGTPPTEPQPGTPGAPGPRPRWP